MDFKYIAYYLVTIILLALFVSIARKKKVGSEGDITVFKYPFYLNVVLVLGETILIGLLLFSLANNYSEVIEQMDWKSIGGFVIVFAINPIGCVYFISTRVILYEDSILKRTPFSNNKIMYKDVKKIVVHSSEGNPGAGMTKIYSDKIMRLAALLEGFDVLRDEVIFRCKKAVVIEK